MSKRMIATFFPASMDLLAKRSRLVSFVINDVFFPDAVALACPEVAVQVDLIVMSNVTIRSPMLLLAAIWGLWIGTIGYHRFATQQQLRGRQLWRFAFLSFGIMNATAIFLHCLCPPVPVTETYPTRDPFLWAVDTYMTGVSSACLLWASLHQHQDRLGHVETLSFVAIQTLGLACIGWFLFDPVPSMIAASHPLEAWYLLSPGLAGPPIVFAVFEDKVRRHLYITFKGCQSTEKPSWSAGQIFFCLGALCVFLGVALDHCWCHYLSSVDAIGNVAWSNHINSNPLVRDFFMASTLTFLGCDFCFWGILLVLTKSKFSEEKDKKK